MKKALAKKELLGGVRDWKALRKVATQGFNDAVICLGTIAIAQRMNRDEVIKPIVEAGAGIAAQTFRDGVLFRAHMLVARAICQ